MRCCGEFRVVSRNAGARRVRRAGIIDRRCRLSQSELDDRVNRVANLLVARGLARGDRLAIYLPNRVEFVVAFLAALKAGVIAVPLNWRLQGPDLQRVLAHCAPSCLVTTSERAAALESGVPNLLTVGEADLSGSFWTELAGQDATRPHRRDRRARRRRVARLLGRRVRARAPGL